MTVIAHRIPAPSPDRRVGQMPRSTDATRRRQDALARLAARRMPLPGVPLTQPGTPQASTRPSGAEPKASPVEPERPALTAREVQVLRTWLMVDSKPAVAQRLHISLGTVNTHLTRVRAKYVEVGRPAATKAALLARAVQDGIIALDEL